MQINSANRTHVPQLESFAINQKPKTSDHREPRLFRYDGTDLYQWFSKVGPTVFDDPFGEPFEIKD